MPRSGLSSVHRFAHGAMATLFETIIFANDGDYARQASAAIFSEVDRITRIFDRFDPTSEVSRIGRLGPGDSMRIGIETVECLGLAARIQDETEGVFDVNFRAEGNLHLSGLLQFKRTSGGFELTRLRGETGSEAPPIDLDLGGIGKGYALDRALEILKDWDVGNALLHAGTSTAIAVGDGPCSEDGGGGWPIGVSGCQVGSQAPMVIRLKNRAVSGSGPEVKGGHITDPRTRRPATGHIASWASHPSATVADALSTAFLIMASDEVRDFCAVRPDVWALVIPGEKKCTIFNEDVFAARADQRSES